MAHGRRREQWNHTAALMAMIAEVNRDAKKRPQPYQPADFHPMGGKRAKGLPLTPARLGRMADSLVPAGQTEYIVQAQKG